MFKLTLSTHEISPVCFIPIFIPFDAMCCVSVLLPAVEVPVGIQQVLGSTPTAVAMPLHCLSVCLCHSRFHTRCCFAILYHMLRLTASAHPRCTRVRQMIAIKPRLFCRPRYVPYYHRHGSATTYIPSHL